MRKAYTNQNSIYVLALFAALMLASPVANAATFTWNLTTGGAWSTAANWSQAGFGGAASATAPAVGDDVIFTTSTTGAVVITLGGAATCKTITINTPAGGSFTLGNDATAQQFTLGTAGTGGSITHTDANNTTVTINCNIALPGPTTFSVTSGTGTMDFINNAAISGIMSGIGPVTIGTGSSTGTVQFRNTTTTVTNNTISGTLTIISGRLNWAGTASGQQFALGANAKTVIINGATAVLGLTTATADPGTGNLVISIGATGGTLDVASGFNLLLNDAGQLAGAGGGQLIKTGAGSLTLNSQAFAVGANTTLRIDVGTVTINAAGNFGGTSGNTITLNGGTLSTSSNIAYNNSIVYNSGTFTDGNTANSVTTYGNLTVNTGATFTPGGVAAGSTLLFNGTGTLGNGSSISAAQNITVTGATTVTTAATLTGAGTFKLGGDIQSSAGAATLTKTGAGSFIYNGTQTATNPANIAISTGTFGGTGTLLGTLTQAAGAVAPGDAILVGGTLPGVLTLGSNFTYTSGVTSTFQLGTISDRVQTSAASNGSITLNSNAFTLVPATGFDVTQSYTLVQTGGTGTITGTPTITMPGYTFSTATSTSQALIVSGFTQLGGQLHWTGAVSSDLANAANWLEGVAPNGPNAPYELVFDTTGAGGLTNTLAANTSVHRLTFLAGGYNLAGNALTVLADTTGSVGKGITSATGTNIISLAIVLGSVTTDVDIAAGTLLINGVISGGPGGLSKSGAGSLTLSAANTFVPSFALNAGTLAVGVATALGTATNTFTYAGGTIDASVTGLTIANPLIVNANITFGGSFPLTLSSAFALGTNRTITCSASNNNALTLSGIISGGSGTFTKAGPGQLNLTGVNTFTSTVAHTAGTLAVGLPASLGAVTNAITIADGTFIDATAATTTINYASITLNGNFTYIGTNALNFGTTAVALGATRIITTRANTLTFGGVISGPTFGITKNGAGTLALNGTNTFTGPVTINAGIVTNSNVAGMGAPATAVVNFGPNSTGTWTLGIATSIAQLTTDATAPGTPTLGGAFVLTLTGANNSTFQGATAAVVFGFTLNNATGTLTLSPGSGAYAHSGVTTVTAGQLNINGPTVLGSGQLTLASGAKIDNTSGAPITLTTNNALSVATGFTFVGTNSLTFGSGTVTMTATTSITTTAGTLTFGGPVAGAFALTKLGAGVLALNGVNTYSVSPTTITAGTLLVNGSTVVGVTVAVGATGTLGGSGSVLGPTTIAAGGVLAPGLITQSTSAATFTTAAITGTGVAKYLFRLNGIPATTATAGNDFVNAGTSAVATGTLAAFTITGGAGFTNGGVYRLINTTATPTGTYATPVMPTGWTGALSNIAGGVNLTVTQAANTWVWVGGTSGDMSLPANWSPATQPTAGADLIFPATATTFALTFNNSNNTVGDLAVNSMLFSPNATGYTITAGTVTSVTLPAASPTLTPLSCTNTTAVTNTLNFNFTMPAASGGNSISVAGTGTLVIGTGANTLASTTLLNINSPGNTTINSVISGTAVTVTSIVSGGTVTLAGANTYTGATTVPFGTLKLGNATALGTTGPATISSGAILDVNGSSGVSVPVTISGSGTGTGALINSSAAAASMPAANGHSRARSQAIMMARSIRAS